MIFLLIDCGIDSLVIKQISLIDIACAIGRIAYLYELV